MQDGLALPAGKNLHLISVDVQRANAMRYADWKLHVPQQAVDTSMNRVQFQPGLSMAKLMETWLTHRAAQWHGRDVDVRGTRLPRRRGESPATCRTGRA